MTLERIFSKKINSSSSHCRLTSANHPSSFFLFSLQNKGQNPNCLCNIIPAPDAFRRAGLWAKNSDVTSGLGFDPSDRRREDPSTPVGLRNLGNTCYVNSVLQCLFSNADFRNAVYAAAPPVSEDPVVKALKDLFVQMQQGPASPVDPAPLATALQLDHAVQQDGQEFMKLLLTLLEHRFASQPNLHGLIQNLFRGQSGYETLCMTCNTPSESSSRSDNFYELDVPVRGFKSLDASLTTLLSPEILDGDNQFSCDRCAAKRDATRRLQIRSLPPMLCLSLQRFVYDFVKGDRVKASDKFAFPLELPASALVGGIEQQGLHEHHGGSGSGGGEKEIYDLEAILIHKGGSALQGHYVAHIKLYAAPDGTGGTWWRFDDETVTKMEEGPFGTTDHGAGAGGMTGISNAKGASGSGSGDASGATAKKKPCGGAKKQTTKKGAGATATAAGKKGGKATTTKTKKQAPAMKKGAGARKKRNEWSDSDNVVDSEANITDAEEEGAAAAAVEDDELAMALKASLAAATGGGTNVGEVVDLLKEETEEEKKKKRTEIVSSNAYLLVYRRRHRSLDDLPSAAAAGTAATTIGELGGVLDPETAQWLEDSKARLAEEFEKQCDAYKTAKADAERQLTTRRQEVRSLLESASGYQNITSGNGGPSGGNDEVKEGGEAVKEEEEKNKKPPPPRRGAAAATKAKTKPPPTLESIFPDGDCGRFISTTWLQQWADAPASSPPPPIDNAPLLCQHGKLDPSRPAVMRRLPTHAWTALASNYRGGPELKPCDACPVCLGEVLDSIAAAEDSSEAREYYLDVVELLLSSSNPIKEEEDGIVDDDDEERMEVEEENGGAVGSAGGRSRKAAQKKMTAAISKAVAAKPTTTTTTTTTVVPVTGVPAYYVSKPWLQAWLRRGGKSMGTTPPTQALCCPHGGLLPELQSSTKRIGISEDFWAFLKRSWQSSETERLRKVRAKAAEKLRKNQGGAAVLIDGGDSSKEKKEEEEVIMLDGEGEMVEIDGVQVFLPADTKETTTIRGKKEEDDDGDIEIVESPKRSPQKEEEQEAAAAGSGSGSKNANTSTAVLVSMDVTPLPEFRIHTKECRVCCEEITKATQLSKGLHSRVQAEKASLAHLLTPGFLQLTQRETYYLIPRAFMDHWRAFMMQASIGRRGAVAAVAAGAGGATARSDFLEAPSLADYMKRAACDCHSDPHLLAYAPPQVVNRRGRWLVVNNSENTINVAGVAGGGGGGNAAVVEDPFGFFELVSVADWSAFVEHYAEEELVFGVEGISATLHIEEVEKDKKQSVEEAGDLEKKSDSPAGVDGVKKEDEAMPDAPPLPLATATTNTVVAATTAAATAAPTKRTRAQDADLVDSDAQLAKALADVEAEDAKAAAKENGELESDSDEGERKGKRKKQSVAVVKKQAFKNLNEIDEEDDIIPVSQVDDVGAVFGQDPDFLYERKPGGNAHLRPGAAGKAWLITKPATCTATLEARQVAVKAARLSYTGAEIMVEISLTDDEAIAATFAAVAATGKGVAAAAAGGGRTGGGVGVGGSDVLGERKSKRARKGRAPVTVDCTSTLHDLRLRIYQAVGVHPRNARLYFRGRQISDRDEITLAELEIYPNEEIRVVDTQEHDPDDLTGLFLSSDSGKKGRRGGPEGFGGTALTGLHLVESNNDLGGGGGLGDMQ